MIGSGEPKFGAICNVSERRSISVELAVNHKQAVLLGLLCSALAAAACSVASAEVVTSGAAKEKDDTVPVPEVVIKGHREKLSQLEAEIVKAQDAFYDAFNQANKVKEYETHCEIGAPIGTFIKTRVCNPEFVHTATSDEARRVMNQYPGRPSGDPGPTASMVISGKMPAYHKYVHDLVRQNPNLRKTLGVYYALTQHYLAVRKEKFKGKWFVWD